MSTELPTEKKLLLLLLGSLLGRLGSSFLLLGHANVLRKKFGEIPLPTASIPFVAEACCFDLNQSGDGVE